MNCSYLYLQTYIRLPLDCFLKKRIALDDLFTAFPLVCIKLFNIRLVEFKSKLSKIGLTQELKTCIKAFKILISTQVNEMKQGVEIVAPANISTCSKTSLMMALSCQNTWKGKTSLICYSGCGSWSACINPEHCNASRSSALFWGGG